MLHIFVLIKKVLPVCYSGGGHVRPEWIGWSSWWQSGNHKSAVGKVLTDSGLGASRKSPVLVNSSLHRSGTCFTHSLFHLEWRGDFLEKYLGDRIAFPFNCRHWSASSSLSGQMIGSSSETMSVSFVLARILIIIRSKPVFFFSFWADSVSGVPVVVWFLLEWGRLVFSWGSLNSLLNFFNKLAFFSEAFF